LALLSVCTMCFLLSFVCNFTLLHFALCVCDYLLALLQVLHSPFPSKLFFRFVV
jgi:hypothetical protein